MIHRVRQRPGMVGRPSSMYYHMTVGHTPACGAILQGPDVVVLFGRREGAEKHRGPPRVVHPQVTVVVGATNYEWIGATIDGGGGISAREGDGPEQLRSSEREGA